MDKQGAIKWIKSVREGSGVNRHFYPEEMRGRMANDYWNEDLFSYGFEYGFIHGLMTAFDVKKEDL